MDWSAVFSVTVLHGYIPQILLAEALYTLRLPRRSRFWLRLCIGLPVCAFLAVVIPNIVAQLTAGLFSILIFLLTFALCCFLFESRWTHVLFCCVSAQFTQNLSYNIESLVEMPLGEISLWQMGAISVACMALVYLACYMLFARRIKVIRMDARWVLPMAVATGLFVYVMQFLLQVYGLDGMWVARLPLVACCIFGLCMLYGFLAYKDEQAENDRKELRLLAEKCRLLCDRLTAKYPDEEDVSDFQAFTHSLLVYLGEEEQDEPEFDMEEVLNPKYPLDLSKLCKELGLMEEDS